MTIQLTQEQGAYIKKQIAIQQEDRKNGILEVFPHLSEADRKALKIDVQMLKHLYFSCCLICPSAQAFQVDFEFAEEVIAVIQFCGAFLPYSAAEDKVHKLF